MAATQPFIDFSAVFPHTAAIQTALKPRAAALHMRKLARVLSGGRGVNIRQRVALPGAILFGLSSWPARGGRLDT